MKTPLEAWIVTIGNEIINAVISDTNREAISRELRGIGITVKGMLSVGDDPEQIADALNTAMDRAPVTVVSGGLGPTEDDKTSAAAALFMGVGLRTDEEQLARITDRFRRWGRPMALSNAKQALFPVGAAPIPNDYGTAPGFQIERDGRIALFFPGVPRELVRMLREQGIPAIVKRFGQPGEVFGKRTLQTYGTSESRLQEILEDVSADEEGFHLAFLPRFPIIRLRMDVRATSTQEVEARLADKERLIMERLGENVISNDGRSMEQVVLRLMEERGLTLALAESITGGMIGEMITRSAGSSRTFMGSIVSYSNEMKTSVLGVADETLRTHGAVSHQCARDMAIGAARVGKAHVGLSVTGIAGPDGGTPDKPVGTFYVGLSTPEVILARGFLLAGDRPWVKTLAAMQALDMLRRHLLGLRLHGTEDGEKR